MAARVAVSADEAVGEGSAAQVAAKLLLHVARQRRLVGLARVGEEGLEVVAHDGVEHRLGGATRTVGGSEGGQASPRFAGLVPASDSRIADTCEAIARPGQFHLCLGTEGRAVPR